MYILSSLVESPSGSVWLTLFVLNISNSLYYGGYDLVLCEEERNKDCISEVTVCNTKLRHSPQTIP